MRPNIRKIFRSTALRIAAGFALAALTLVLLGWLVTGPYRSVAADLDAPIRSYVRELRSPLLTSFFVALTKLGSTLYLSIIGSIAGLAFLGLRWFRALGLFIIAMAGQAFLHHEAKLLFARPRPPAIINYPIGESFSFPSGHALSSLCLYIGIAWLVTNRIENSAAKVGIWAIAVLLVLLIGVSRIYIGIHYPSDVIAGFVSAAIWTAAVISNDRKPL